MSFEQELRILINRHSKENESNTPDYILAGYIQGCLQTFNCAVKRRDIHFGKHTTRVHTRDVIPD